MWFEETAFMVTKGYAQSMALARYWRILELWGVAEKNSYINVHRDEASLMQEYGLQIRKKI